jgi:dTDP-3,4-didehydro-2,6-dideoxy-alpha-D-glucose 3-reductase
VIDALVIGYSTLARSKLLPALVGVEGIGRIHLATRQAGLELRELPEEKRGTIHTGYQKALREAPKGLAYVSLPNHLHAPVVTAALEAGFHVVVDKPAFLTRAESQAQLAAAKARGLCLAEATVWGFHQQVAVAQHAFASAHASPGMVQAVFSFPPLPADNFRNHPEMGGGSLNDLGPYAVSAARAFLPGDPVEIHARVLCRHPRTGVDTAFAVSMVYEHGEVFQGFFGFGTEYRNRLSIVGPGVSVELDPAFTTPEAPVSVRVRRTNVEDLSLAPRTDTFRVFLTEVVRSISEGNGDRWTSLLEWDDRILNRVAEAAGVIRNGS